MATAEQAEKQEHLTDEKLGLLTGAAVERLNREAGKNIKSWVALGKIVQGYITSLRKMGCNEDPFKLLAAHPESVHQPSQLRNYEACYRLWEELGGENGAPAVSMTHFIVVLSQDIDFDEKKRLLEQAAQEGLSVAELKKLIYGEPEPAAAEPEQPQPGIDGPAQDNVEPVAQVAPVEHGQQADSQPVDGDEPRVAPVETPIDWKTGLSAETERTLDRLSQLAEQKGDEPLPEETREKVVVLVRFVMTHFLSQQDIDAIVSDINVRA